MNGDPWGEGTFQGYFGRVSVIAVESVGRMEMSHFD